ncbi:MFS transporter [Angelakisella massiliensis]|uniref:MFS transporter n=1 Tax=Angelakisella massiliensis TaxID=1871018 RepID=UPI0008F7FA14|nr:MFS transporter [Angelakisella massiliensis]
MVLHFSCTPCARRMLWLALLQGLVFYAPVATLYRQVRGVSLFQITLMEGISLGLSIVLELPWGIVSERIGYRRTLLFCSALYLLSKIIFWQANGFFLFLLERLLLAVVLAGFSGVDAAYLTAVTPSSQRQHIFGLYEGASTAGLLLADLCFSFLPSGDYSEAALLTVFAYTAALLCAFGLKEVPCQQISQKFSFQFFLSLFPKGRVILLLIGSALLLESCQTITVFFSQPLMTAAGFPSPLLGVLHAAMVLCGFSSLFSEHICRLMGRQNVLLLVSLCTALVCLILALPLSWSILGLSLLLLRCTCGILAPLSLALRSEAVADAGSMAARLSAQSCLMNLLAVVTNLFFGTAAQKSLSCGIIMGILFSLAAFIFFIIYCIPKRMIPSKR